MAASPSPMLFRVITRCLRGKTFPKARIWIRHMLPNSRIAVLPRISKRAAVFQCRFELFQRRIAKSIGDGSGKFGDRPQFLYFKKLGSVPEFPPNFPDPSPIDLDLKLPDDLRVVLPKGLLICQIRIDRLDFSIRIRDARNDGVIAGGKPGPIVREEFPRVGC